MRIAKRPRNYYQISLLIMSLALTLSFYVPVMAIGTPTVTATPTSSATRTFTALAVAATPSATSTPLATKTNTPPSTSTLMATRTNAPVSTSTPTVTKTATPTSTSQPTATSTLTVAKTATPTLTSQPTATSTPTLLRTATATATPTNDNTEVIIDLTDGTPVPITSPDTSVTPTPKAVPTYISLKWSSFYNSGSSPKKNSIVTATPRSLSASAKATPSAVSKGNTPISASVPSNTPSIGVLKGSLPFANSTPSLEPTQVAMSAQDQAKLDQPIETPELSQDEISQEDSTSSAPQLLYAILTGIAVLIFLGGSVLCTIGILFFLRSNL